MTTEALSRPALLITNALNATVMESIPRKQRDTELIGLFKINDSYDKRPVIKQQKRVDPRANIHTYP